MARVSHSILLVPSPLVTNSMEGARLPLRYCLLGSKVPLLEFNFSAAMESRAKYDIFDLFLAFVWVMTLFYDS